MVISLVASFSNGSSITSPSTSRNVTLPASGIGGTPQVGDLVIGTWDHQGSGTTNSITSTPANFNDLLGGLQSFNISSTTGGYAAYWKFLDASDIPGTTVYTLTWQFVTRTVEQLSVWRGVDPVTPFDAPVVQTNTGSAGSTTKTIPSNTPIQNNSLWLALIGLGGTGLSTTAPTVTTASGLTLVVQDGSSTGANVKNAVASHQYALLSGSSAGIATAAPTVTTSVATAGVTASVLLRATTLPLNGARSFQRVAVNRASIY